MDNLNTALAYASKGLSIFPIIPGGKKPATGHGVKDATTDAEAITDWWSLNPDFNIAIATGRPSNLIVIDVDEKHDGQAGLDKLVAECGELPETIEATTGAGRHIYFRCEHPDIKNSVSKLALGVDVRGTGGYVVCPPSVHPNGMQYRWSGGKTLADLPEWLLNRLYCLDRPERARIHGTEWQQLGDALPDWKTLLGDGIPDGRRDDTLTRIVGHLFAHRVHPDMIERLIHALNQAECKPPLPDAEVQKVFESILTAEYNKRFPS